MDKLSDVLVLERKDKELKKVIRENKLLQKQKKEQLTLETALEKIRSESMAMQTSNDILKVAYTLLTELNNVNLDFDVAVIDIPDFKSKSNNFWIAVHDHVYAQKICVPYFDHPIVKLGWEEYKSGKKIFKKRFTKEQKDTYFEHGFQNTDFKYIPENRKEYILEAKSYATNWAFGKYTFVGLSSFKGKLLPDEKDYILIKFANTFEQAYIRFLDIKKAEEQAREALKQASLDHVRGEIASMRSKSDLNRITPLIWQELKNLGVPFFRCGVFIINETTQKVQVYLTTPEGDALAVLNLAFDENKLTKNTVAYWRKNQVYKEHWNKEDFLDWTRSMMKLGQVQSAESYQGSASAPESLNLHFVPFKQGMLYVGNTSPLPENKIELVKSLAEAFSMAYARYDDFRLLEQAKSDVENTLDKLKSTQTKLIHSEKMASLGELTAGIAHEIQNPLNFVNNFSEINKELLLELKIEIENNNEEEIISIAKDVIDNEEKIIHHAKRAESIVKGMLLHSRSSTGQKELVDINTLCNEYLSLAYHGFRAKDKSFIVDYQLEADELLPKIEVVPQDFGRVLLNLLNNAFYAVSVKSADPNNKSYNPSVKISTKYSSSKEGKPAVKICIRDNGNGIPDNLKDKIFQPFMTTKPTGQGTGLGLSISYDIIKAHGGELTFETKEGTGSEFTIILPEG